MVPEYERYTDHARRVLTLAEEEARRFHHKGIGTEHLLLGLVREGDGVAAKVLDGMGVQLPKVRRTVEYILGYGDSTVRREMDWSPRAKKVLALSVDEAGNLNHHTIGTEHLLLAIVREGQGIPANQGKGIGAGVLESLGLRLDDVRHEVLRAMAGRTSGDKHDHNGHS